VSAELPEDNDVIYPADPVAQAAPYAEGGDRVDPLSRAEGLVDVEVWLTKEDVVDGLDTVRERPFEIIRESRAG
jgi:hypothetical protein